jgi:hypothetical protein
MRDKGKAAESSSASLPSSFLYPNFPMYGMHAPYGTAPAQSVSYTSSRGVDMFLDEYDDL